MRQYLLGLLLLGVFVAIESRSRRWRRQVIPSQHVQVFNLDASTIFNNNNNNMYVESTESRIDLKERAMNGSVWSDHSLLHFDLLDTFVNITADNVESYLTIANGASFHGQSIKSDIYLHTNRTQSGDSAISQSLSGSANFSVEDEALRLQVVNGRKISIEAETWQRSIQPKMTLNAEAGGNTDRELRFEALDPAYHLLATYAGSTIFITFADKIIRLDGDYRDVEIFTDKFNVTVITRNEPYDVTLTQEEVIINLPTQRTRVCVTLDGVSVKSNQVAKTHIEKNDATMTVSGERVQDNGATLIAGTTSLELSNAGQITADLTNARVIADNNIQRVGLVSGHNSFIIDQGYPNITVDPGDSCVIILGNRGLPNFTDLIPPFQWPEDKFQSIGPFGGNQEDEAEFLNKPSCCYFEPQTGSATWSEWGNNGNNGGWNSPAGQGTTVRQRGTTSISTRRPGTATTHAPEFGRWPTFSPREDELVTRRQWPETFDTSSTSAPGNWEDTIGCNCHSTLAYPNSPRATARPTYPRTTTIRTTIEPDFLEPEESIDEGSSKTTEDLSLTTVVPDENGFPSPEQGNFEPLTTEISTAEEGTLEVVTIPIEIGTTVTSEELPQPMPLSTVETATTEPFPNPFPTLVSENGEEVTSSEEDNVPTPEDFDIYQYGSTLYPQDEEITIEATLATVAVDVGNQSEDELPVPETLLSTTDEQTSESNEGAGGSFADDESPGEPSQPLSNNSSPAKRSPMKLTLRLPENVVGRKIDPSSIRESLRRVIRKAAHHKITKREAVDEEDLINIQSIQEHDGNLEIVFNMAGNETIDEKELLSLSNQEISQYFELPVVSLTRVEEYGDRRILYILVALGLVLMSVFCLCCLFQTIVKRMSDALLVSVGKRFQKHPPGDILQYQNTVAPC